MQCHRLCCTGLLPGDELHHHTQTDVDSAFAVLNGSTGGHAQCTSAWELARAYWWNAEVCYPSTWLSPEPDADRDLKPEPTHAANWVPALNPTLTLSTLTLNLPSQFRAGVGGGRHRRSPGAGGPGDRRGAGRHHGPARRKPAGATTSPCPRAANAHAAHEPTHACSAR